MANRYTKGPGVDQGLPKPENEPKGTQTKTERDKVLGIEPKAKRTKKGKR